MEEDFALVSIDTFFFVCLFLRGKRQANLAIKSNRRPPPHQTIRDLPENDNLYGRIRIYVAIFRSHVNKIPAIRSIQIPLFFIIAD